MKIPSSAVAGLSALALSIECCRGFQIAGISGSNVVASISRPTFHRVVRDTALAVSFMEKESSSSSSSNAKSGDISEEIAAGIQLTTTTTTTTTLTTKTNRKESTNGDDVTVVDYADVSNRNSLMEIALREAREKVRDDASATSAIVEGGRLMGINDEVVKEVGREIGNFDSLARNPALLQKTAARLRAKAAPGLFAPISEMTTSSSDGDVEIFSSEDVAAAAECDALIEATYAESGEVTEAFAKTFYLGTQLLPEAARRAIWAVYVWCRRTDEIVDAPRNCGSDEENNAAMLRDLAVWEDRLERLWTYGHAVDALDLPLLDARVSYPSLSVQPFVDMIRGMLMDIPKLGVERYRTWDDLHLYCYRVAGTVGLMSMPIFGTKPGITVEDAKEPALSLGVAFQITNILRDVGEDASTRGRVYLPTSHLEKFNVTEEQLFAQRLDDNYVELLKYEIDLARKYYDKAQEGVYMLAPESRLPTQVSLDCYRKILNKIEANGYDSLNKRAYVDKWEKLFTIPFSWYRTQEALHNAFPIPEDW